MLPTEKSQFADLLLTAYRFAGKNLTAEAAADWWDELVEYPLAEIAAAFRCHRRASPYPPKPFDIHRYLAGAVPGGTLSSSAVGLLRYARTAYPVRAPQLYHGVRGGGH